VITPGVGTNRFSSDGTSLGSCRLRLDVETADIIPTALSEARARLRALGVEVGRKAPPTSIA
jgi:hypothetical protein